MHDFSINWIWGPQLVAFAGGVLIGLSGVLSIILGIRIRAWVYDVYPGGKMGHIGILAGAAALALGLIIIFLLAPLYESTKTTWLILSAILTFVLGHAGAVFGAMYVGTAGVALCYIAGIWQLIAVIRGG